MKIRQWRGVSVTNVLPTLHLPGTASGNDDRQVHVVVNVGIAHTAAVENHRMIQQRSVAIRRLLQLLQVVCEKRNVERIDLRHLRLLLRITAIVH